MSDIVIYEQSTGEIIQFLPSKNTPDFEGQPNILINPDITLFRSKPPQYLKVQNGIIVEKNADECSAWNEAHPQPPELNDRMTTAETTIQDHETRIKTLEKP